MIMSGITPRVGDGSSGLAPYWSRSGALLQAASSITAAAMDSTLRLTGFIVHLPRAGSRSAVPNCPRSTSRTFAS